MDLTTRVVTLGSENGFCAEYDKCHIRLVRNSTVTHKIRTTALASLLARQSAVERSCITRQDLGSSLIVDAWW